MSVLSTTTGLLSVLVFLINSLCKCLFVCYLRSTYVCFYIELTKKTIYDNFQMKFAHSGDDCLTSFLICMSTESRILFCQFGKSFTHFTLVILCFRLDCKLDNRLREFHRLKDNRILLITDCITCCCDLESYRCCDIS